MANAKRTENFNLLNLNSRLNHWVIGMRGIKTSSPLNIPIIIIVASIKLEKRFFTISLVLLHNFGVDVKK